MDLSLITSNLLDLISLRRTGLRKGKVDPQQVMELSRMYRHLGCGLLLLGEDADSFFGSLFQAADLYLQFLERERSKRHLDPYSMARGRAEPLLDAFAIGNMELARRIDALARTEFREGMEYEEDFWFFTLLPQLAASRTNTPEILSGLKQMGESLQGVPYPRHDVLKALSQNDSKVFDTALKALLKARSDELKRKSRTELGNPYSLSTEGRVFVEGIALLRVARARGLQPRITHRLLPEAALAPTGKAPRRTALWKKAARAKQPRAKQTQSRR